VDNVEEKLEKEEEDYQLEFIMEKVENSLSVVQLRETLISFPIEKCVAVFEKVLTQA
jgi:hypothetical protein